MIEWVVDQPGIRLGLGDSVGYDGDADLVFSHLYGPLPPQLVGKPAIINVFGNKKAKAEEWCGAPLVEVSKWGRGLTNTIYFANIEPLTRCDLTDLVEDEVEPGRGWFPEELCERLLNLLGAYEDTRDMSGVVFDGFMGRGTTGRVARKLGLDFVGIDRDPDRVMLAAEYLGC